MLRYLFALQFFFLSFYVNAQADVRLERVKTIPSSAIVNDILAYKNSVFVAASTGLYKIDSDDLQTRLLSDKNIDAITHDKKGVIWASIDGKYLQNMSSGTTTQYNSPGIEIRDLEYSTGKIWIASNQGIITVVTKTNKVGRVGIDKRSGLPSNNVSFIHIDHQKQIWIGTDKGLVFINKKNKWKTYEKKLSMQAMHYNHEGLWLVTNEEMWVIDPFNRWYPAAIDNGLRKGKIRDITADSTGRLYMASEILVRYDPYNESIESYADNTSIVSKECTSVESDQDNRLWLGTNGGGLFLFGYADQAKAVADLVTVLDKKIEEAKSGGTPVLEIAMVESDIIMDDGEKKATEDQANASPASAINSSDGISAPLQGENSSPPPSEQGAKPKSAMFRKLEITAVILTPIFCNREEAEVVIEVHGGVKPYQIRWDDVPDKVYERSLKSGTYKVTVRDSMGQMTVDFINIESSPALLMEIVTMKSPTSEGRSDGNVKIAITGGLAPYEISWDNGEKGERARRLKGGSHVVSVVDAGGCKVEKEIKLKHAKIIPELQIANVTLGQKLEIKNIYYEADSTDLSAGSFDALDEIYDFLKENEAVKIEVGGHTNSLPADEYCDRVSTARAKSVADYLYEKGISQDRITYKGYGKREPIASNKTKVGRKRNQRVEVQIIQLKK